MVIHTGTVFVIVEQKGLLGAARCGITKQIRVAVIIRRPQNFALREIVQIGGVGEECVTDMFY